MKVCNVEEVIEEPLMLEDRLAKNQNIYWKKQDNTTSIEKFPKKVSVKVRTKENGENVKPVKKGKLDLKSPNELVLQDQSTLEELDNGSTKTI